MDMTTRWAMIGLAVLALWSGALADEKPRKEPPKSVPHTNAYQRPVVIEEFTGTWCGPCYGAGMALDLIEQEYSRDQVLVVAYHMSDAYSIPIGGDRQDYYGVSAYPTVWFNGMGYAVGGTTWAAGPAGYMAKHNLYVQGIAAEQAWTAGTVPFELSLAGRVGPSNPQMTLTVRTSTGYPRSVNAVFLITEDGIVVSNPSNGKDVLNAVARAHLGTRTVSLPTAGTIVLNVSYSGTIPFVAANRLHPVVFLQDDFTGEIVAGVGSFAPVAGAARWRLYE
jgi:thiol-disulfide isomerase/thioredoxin